MVEIMCPVIAAVQITIEICPDPFAPSSTIVWTRGFMASTGGHDTSLWFVATLSHLETQCLLPKSIYLAIYLSSYLSICLLSLSIPLYLSLPLSISISISIYLYIYLYLYLYFSFFGQNLARQSSFSLSLMLKIPNPRGSSCIFTVSALPSEAQQRFRAVRQAIPLHDTCSLRAVHQDSSR